MEWKGIVPYIGDLLRAIFGTLLPVLYAKFEYNFVALVKGVLTAFGAVLDKTTTLAFGNGHIAAYIAFVLFVLFVMGVGFTIRNVSMKPNVKVPQYQNPFARYISTSFSPSYKTNLFFKNLTPYSGEEPTTERPTVVGRCDNLTMREASFGGGGLCIKTSIPKPLTWIIDPDTMPELNNLHPLLKSKIAGDKYTVSIPFTVYQQDGMNYYPDCSKATFADGTTASHLFEDNGTSTCNKRKIVRTPYREQARPIDIGADTYKGLATYATENNPMC